MINKMKKAESTLGPINMQNKKVLGIIAVAIIVVLAGGALLIPSLTSSDIPSAPSGAKMGGTLTMAMASEPNYLDPADWWGSSDIQMIDQIFDSLIQFGFDFKPYPRLAESWTVSDDGKVWTFNIRSGVKFHDGHELTSADVKYSYERILDPDTKAVRRSSLTNNAKIESISTPDDNTVIFTLKSSNVDGLGVLGREYIVHKDAVDKWGRADFKLHPVGTGPFVFEEWVPKEKLVLVANEDYWQGRPYIDSLVVRFIPEVGTQLAELESGRIDLIGQFASYDEAERLKSDPNMQVFQSKGTRIMTFYFNLDREPFDDVRVRQAIAHAIDKEEVVKGAYRGFATPATNVVPKGMGEWFDSNVTDLEYDPEKSKALLKEAGFPNGFEYEYLILDRTPWRDVALIVQQQLSEVGIKAQLEPMASSKKFYGERDFWTHNGGLDLQYPSPDNYFFRLGFSEVWENNGCCNLGKVIDSDLDAAILASQSELDPAKRKEYYSTAAQIINDNAYYVIIAYEDILSVATSNVNGFQPWPARHGMVIHNPIINAFTYVD